MHLREDKFPSKRKSKVAPRVDGPFIVIAKITDNASTLDFSGDFGWVLATFNVRDFAIFGRGKHFRFENKSSST